MSRTTQASGTFASQRAAFLRARAQTRAARRLASRTAAIAVWWGAMAAPRPDFYTPLSLSAALGQPMRRIAAALRWLGWRKIIRRVHGKQVPLWLPPSTAIVPRKPGRPRLYAPAIRPGQER